MSFRRGFTLLETAIVLGIAILSLVALINLFLTFNRVYGYEQVYTNVAGSANESMAALEAAVLPADSILASHAFLIDTYTSGTSTLVLELPSVNASGNIVTGAKDYVVFYASSTSLYRRIEADAQSSRVSSTKQLSRTLSVLSFTYDPGSVVNSKSVTATLQMLSDYKGQPASTTLREKLYLRN